MAKKKTESHMMDWEKTFNKMSQKKLQEIIVGPKALNPEMLKLAVQLERKNAEKNAPLVMKVFLKALKKRCVRYKLNGQNVEFTYRRRQFFADLDLEEDFVIIKFIHNIFIDKRNKAKLLRLKRAVNTSNKLCSASTYYEGENNNEFDFVYVVSSSTIHFIAENPIFESELFVTLEGCLSANDVVTVFSKKYLRKKSFHRNCL